MAYLDVFFFVLAKSFCFVSYDVISFFFTINPYTFTQRCRHRRRGEPFQCFKFNKEKVVYYLNLYIASFAFDIILGNTFSYKIQTRMHIPYKQYAYIICISHGGTNNLQRTRIYNIPPSNHTHIHIDQPPLLPRKA